MITNSLVPGGNHPNQAGNNLAQFLANLWQVAIALGGLAFLIYLVVGAFEWITAGGDKQKVESAQRKITQGLIGLALLAGSLVIIKFVSQVLGYNLLKISWPTPSAQQP